MAVQIEDPRREIPVILRMFARQATQSLERNFRTQHIWPDEIYPNFKAVNKRRKAYGKWYATGEGAKSFQFEVMNKTENNPAIRLEYNDYLRFAEMGVGNMRPLSSVEHGKKAKHNRRYVRIWDTEGGRTHRPSIMMEGRHVASRMGNYYADYLGREVYFFTYRTFSGIGAIDVNV